MIENTLVATINYEVGLQLEERVSIEEIRLQLMLAVNQMIQSDFQKLVSILYRIDVNERKLKYFLHEKVGEDAAGIIADLIIERQLEKIKSRSEYIQRDDDGDEEKW